MELFQGLQINNTSYSVMLSDGNSIYGDVVLDSFNKIARDEDSILNQKYKNKYFGICIMNILTLRVIE